MLKQGLVNMNVDWLDASIAKARGRCRAVIAAAEGVELDLADELAVERAKTILAATETLARRVIR